MSITPEDPNQPGAPAGPPTPPPAWGQPTFETPAGAPAPAQPPAFPPAGPGPDGGPAYPPPVYGGLGGPAEPPAKRAFWKNPRFIIGIVVALLAIGGAILTQRPEVKDDDYAAGSKPTASGEAIKKTPDAKVGDCWKGSASKGYEKAACNEPHDVQVFFVGKARSFDDYRAAGEKLVSGDAQATALCDNAISTVEWTFSEADSANGQTNYLYPDETTLNAAKPSDEALRIVCLIDNASVKAPNSSVIKGF